jgi:hypothetical protein
MKWEYRGLDVPTRGLLGVNLPQEFVEELNRLGQEGWEVAQAVPLAVGAGMTERVVFVLKRPMH